MSLEDKSSNDQNEKVWVAIIGIIEKPELFLSNLPAAGAEILCLDGVFKRFLVPKNVFKWFPKHLASPESSWEAETFNWLQMVEMLLSDYKTTLSILDFETPPPPPPIHGNPLSDDLTLY